MSMRDKVVEFCKMFNVETPIYVEDIANPDAKSIDSIKDKAYRNIAIFRNENYSLKQINDMIRCTIMVDSYSQVPKLLKDLKERIDSLTGYISECENGYRGIHLNFQIDGFNAEIQVHTAEVSFTNQACEAIYKKWRSFNEKVELDKIAREAPNEEEQNRRIKEVLNSAKQASIEYKACRDLFAIQNERTDFDLYKDDISGILTAFTYEYNKKKEELPVDVSKILSQPVFIDNTINFDALHKQALKLNSEAKNRQIKLVSLARECWENREKLDNNIELRDIEKFFKEASIKWDDILYKNIEKRTGSDARFDYLVNPKKFACLKKIYEYALDNNMDISDTSKIVEEFYRNTPINDKKRENTRFSDIEYYDMGGMIDVISTMINNSKHVEKEIVISR